MPKTSVRCSPAAMRPAAKSAPGMTRGEAKRAPIPVEPMPHCAVFLGWPNFEMFGPAHVRITVESATQFDATSEEEARFDLLTYLDRAFGWRSCSLRSIAFTKVPGPGPDPEPLAALRAALPYIERIAETTPTEPARVARRDRAVGDARRLRELIAKMSVS